jgi:rhamnosyltransferase subunit B
MMAVALELQQRGHDVLIATSASYGEKISSVGLGFHPIRPNITPEDNELIRYSMDERGGPEYLIKRLMMPALRQSFDDLMEAVRGADILVSGDLAYAAAVVADLTRVPWVAATMAPLSFFSRYDPPMLLQSAPLALLAQRVPSAYVAIVRLARWHVRDWGAPVYQLRNELGLTPGAEPLFEARGNARALLGMFSPLLGRPQTDWPANARVTGFAFYDRHEPMPDTLRAFLDRGDPPIVFTLGSAAVFDPGSFYRESAEAAEHLGRRAVLLVGPEPQQLPVASERLEVASYAPYSELFPRASAIVHQGGIGTAAQALRAGRPMVIVPFSHDQPDNAARLVRLGVARTIARSKYTAARAAATLRTLLADSAYGERAKQRASEIAHEDGAVAAADVIERTLTARESSESGRS